MAGRTELFRRSPGAEAETVFARSPIAEFFANSEGALAKGQSVNPKLVPFLPTAGSGKKEDKYGDKKNLPPTF